ncbi:hypothetical protein RRG08_033937 [Elysia crispata]|uniref:G-protein coupled receptors family 3 profile domain-containing protein n=1 Tax=Elysia crispata TaxID=231223 RepID=A0AAE0YBE5_9GAST|nr:hypothetical protein RRG08_033937 [Elysia crispata]
MAFAFPNAAAKLCYRFSSVIFIGSLGPSVVFGYKGILLIFGIFLACETQSVRLKQVNNSRFVGMSMLRADERNPATSTEGWPNDKESDSGLPGIRGETSEKFK